MYTSFASCPPRCPIHAVRAATASRCRRVLLLPHNLLWTLAICKGIEEMVEIEAGCGAVGHAP